MSLVTPSSNTLKTILIAAGTVLLFTDVTSESNSDNRSSRSVPILKTKNGIVLSPQPHDDPNDPLVLTSLPRLSPTGSVVCLVILFILSHDRIGRNGDAM